MGRPNSLNRDLTASKPVPLRGNGAPNGVFAFVVFAAASFICNVSFGAARPQEAGEANATQTATIHWERVPLGDALSRLDGVFNEEIFIDRRVDRSRRVSLEADAASLDTILETIASEASLGYSRLGRLTYLGPSQAAEQLRTVAAVRERDASHLPAALRASLLQKESVTWARLTEPRLLTTALVERAGWRIGKSDRIPHDLWAAGRLPELTLAEQLTVLLVGFDLSFTVNEARRTIEIEPFVPVTIRRSYRTVGNTSVQIAQLNQQLSTAAARLEGDTLWLDGRIEDHERLAELLERPANRTTRNRPQRGTRQVYTLRVQEQPVGKVLRELEVRLQWDVEVDQSAIRAAGLTLEKRVSFSVENSDEDELLEALLWPAGLDYRRVGEQLEIVPRQPAHE